MNELRARTRSASAIGIVAFLALAGVSAFLSYGVMLFLGLEFFVVALAGIIGVFLLFKVSTHDLSMALVLWLLSMSGLQYSVRLAMPGLPDLSIDRVLLIWIVVMFLLQLVIYRRRLQGPFALDILILVHTVYIMVSMLFITPGALPAWLMSSLVPLFAFLYGRHIIKHDNQIRLIFLFLLALSIYFWVTAIGEHFKLDFLVWPKTILDPTQGQLWHPGRARGPVMHPPLFGQLISMLIPVYFFFITRRVSVLTKSLLGISFAMSLVGLFLAYTRGPWLAAAASLIVLAVLRPKFRKVLTVFTVVGLVIGMLGLYQLANSEFLQERLNEEGTTHNRLAFFIMSAKIIADHPLFGVGYFNARNKLWLYNEGGYIPFFGHISKRSGRDTVPHDIYLGRAADEGLLSIAMLAGMLMLSGREFIAKWRANPVNRWFNRDIMAVMAAILAAYMVGGLVIDYRYFDLINVIVYLFMGVVYAFPIRTAGEGGTAHA